jgi:hypothetical protein
MANPSDIYMTIDSRTLDRAVVILLAAQAATIRITRERSHRFVPARSPPSIWRCTRSQHRPISDGGTPARRCLYTSASVRSDHRSAVAP